jgi:NAD/NADP transhydrogenase beta subunit
VDFSDATNLQHSRILLFEAGVAGTCVAVAFCVSVVMKLIEKRKHPFGMIRIYLPVLAGLALAVVLSVSPKAMPVWLFGLNLLVGLAAGFVGYLLAPSKSRMRPLLQRKVRPATPQVAEVDPELKLADKLPEYKLRRVPAGMRRDMFEKESRYGAPGGIRR